MEPSRSSQKPAEFPPEFAPSPDTKYQVERILTQEEADGEIMYLVKWKDYDDRYCTWELAESFETPNTISTWQEQLARGDVLDKDQVEEVLDRMDLFRSQQAEAFKQKRSISGHNSGELALRNTTKPKSDHPSPRSRAVSPSLSAPATPKAPTAHIHREDGPHEKISATAASKSQVSTCTKNVEALQLRKRRRSSTSADEQLKRAKRLGKVQKTPSKHTQVPPPIGLIKPSEIGHREPGHHLPATSRRDPFLFSDNRETPRQSTEASSEPCVRPPTSQMKSNKKDHIAQNSPAAPKAVLARSVRLNSTDVVVQLSIGSRKIGPVTLTGLPTWLRNNLLSLKDRNPLALHFKEDFVLNWQQYQKISSGWLPPKPDLDYATVHPFAQAEAASSALAQQLEESDCGAIWVHPNPEKTFVLVLHASTLSHWRQNPYQHIAAKPRRLLVAVRNRVGKGQLARPLVIPSRPPERRLGISAPEPGLHSQIHATGASSTESKVPQETREDASIPAQLSPNGQNMPLNHAGVGSTSNDTIPGITNEKVVVTVSRKSQSSLEVGDTSNMTNTWGTMCDLDYSSMTPWKESTMPFIYIAFGSRYPNEAQEVAKWCAKHTSARLIFVEGQDHHEWQEFYKMCGNKVALTLFSDDAEFCNLPSFGSLLGKYNVADFVSSRLSWQTSNSQLPKYLATPIFNHGTAMLFTEAAMKHTAAALTCMEWFRSESEGKSNRWRVMVRPNIRAWLTRQALHATDDDSTTHYLGLLAVLSELMPCVDVTEPDNNTNMSSSLEKILTRTGKSKSNYVIPLAHIPGYDASPEADEAQTGRRDEILLSHFVGWSALSVDCHRRFLVVEGDDPEESQTPEIYAHAHHIVFKKVTDFAGEREKSERHKRKK
ncbi:hypothetical protein DV738_g4188, partial [Chaetothyriales sp. CBS 135597]